MKYGPAGEGIPKGHLSLKREKSWCVYYVHSLGNQNDGTRKNDNNDTEYKPSGRKRLEGLASLPDIKFCLLYDNIEI
jgi:hypothetical protein